ncbi:dipicolinic acid synthetase, B subunit [Syntrophobotulus glycolicus DSM 8271]|uniref:Dipicolinic acid synthetase, B subunit n=1 Tax=Syntrophobotulus glycolicus (strain DSM 8271 / FlGlyR) TaxID=645991 RepID=F0SU02_SYNGF|nr:dipicolinate synthase subunit B [Syntrophobotulus glycolicus]ADY56525.1 dipicolinic acid synthetase, B subunit [Syntrophobotulus glycolicus DSM 8271]
MRFKGISLAYALTGSHCTLAKAIKVIEDLVREGADITPILSNAVDQMDTRFGKAEEWKQKLETVTGKIPLRTIQEVEPIGPRELFDCMIISPCTGNTIAKLSSGITDSPVLMAAKAHLRNHKPLVLAISTNDALGINAKNIGLLLTAKNIYFVPFGQDDYQNKANSLVAHMEMIPDTILLAKQGKQIQPVLVEYKKE